MALETVGLLVAIVIYIYARCQQTKKIRIKPKDLEGVLNMPSIFLRVINKSCNEETIKRSSVAEHP